MKTTCLSFHYIKVHIILIVNIQWIPLDLDKDKRGEKRNDIQIRENWQRKLKVLGALASPAHFRQSAWCYVHVEILIKRISDCEWLVACHCFYLVFGDSLLALLGHHLCLSVCLIVPITFPCPLRRLGTSLYLISALRFLLFSFLLSLRQKCDIHCRVIITWNVSINKFVKMTVSNCHSIIIIKHSQHPGLRMCGCPHL